MPSAHTPKHSRNVVSMLGQRRRRWANIATTLSECLHSATRQGIHPMLFQCWASVEDGGPTLNQHWVYASTGLHACLTVSPESGET